MIGMLIRLAMLGVLAITVSNTAFAGQAYPSRVIRVVTPFTAGSAADVVARFVTDRVSKSMGARFVIDNKAGAGGNIAAQEVARSAPDGYTIFFTSNSTHAANIHLYKSLPYDPIKDFAPITRFTRNPLVLAIRAHLPAKNIQEFIQYGKANLGKLSFGVGNSSSLANAHLFMSMTGVNAVQATYRGMPPALVDLLGERLDFMMIDPFLIKDHVQSGALRQLGVTSASRLRSLPDVPAIAEAVPGYELVGWIAAFAPAGTPGDIIAKLSGAFVQAISGPEAEEYFRNLAMEPFPSTPEELGAYVREQTAKWGEIISKAGVEKE